MSEKNKRPRLEARIDQLGREVVRAAADNESEAEIAASSPFLYTRLRARIAAERERREGSEQWFAFLGVIRRAMPILILIVVFSIALFWTVGLNIQPAGKFNGDAFLGTRNTGFEQVVFTDSQTLSSDDVLSSIIEADDREEAK